MTEKINWNLDVQVDGGPKLMASDKIEDIEAYDKFDIKIASDGTEKEILLMPDSTGKVKFLLIKSDNYGDKLKYKVSAAADFIELDAVHLFIGDGAVGLLKVTDKLIFKNELVSEGKKLNASIQILIGRMVT